MNMFQREIPRPAIPRNLGPGWETQSFLTKNQLPIGEATKLCQKITHDTNPKRHDVHHVSRREKLIHPPDHDRSFWIWIMKDYPA